MRIRTQALKRLRRTLFLEIRDGFAREISAAELAEQAEFKGILIEGRLKVGTRDMRFWPAAARVLDLLDTVSAHVSEAGGGDGGFDGAIDRLFAIRRTPLADSQQVAATIWV